MTKFISFLSFVFALIAFVAHVDGLKTSSFASFAGRLKSNGVRGRAGTFLHAKRRTKISKKKQGGGSASSSVSRTSIQSGGANSALPQDEVPAVVPEESVGVAANSNYVQTAPIVINKGKEGLSDSAKEEGGSDEWGVVPDEENGSTSGLLESVQSKFLGEKKQNEEQEQMRKRKLDLGGSFRSDFDDFNDRLLEGSESRRESIQNEKQESGPVKTAKDILSFVLVADFFLVIFFLVWFLAAAATQKANPYLLERFQDIFQPVIVPSLTVLMAGSIASGVLDDKKQE